MPRGFTIVFKNEDERFLWPDDESFEERPPRTIVDRLRDFLHKKRLASDEPWEHSFYGWSIRTVVAGRTIEILVQGGGDWFVTAHQVGWLNFRRAEEPLAECYRRLEAVIREWIDRDLPGSTGIRSEPGPGRWSL